MISAKLKLKKTTLNVL